MFPSSSQKISEADKKFLVAGFEASDAFFNGVVRRFTENEELWMKGPWLQMDYPSGQTQGEKLFSKFRD